MARKSKRTNLHPHLQLPLGLKIRKAKATDLRPIANLFIEEFSKRPYNEKWVPRIAMKKVKKYFRTCAIFICCCGKEIAGFVIFNPEYWFAGKICFIDEIVVRKSFQGKGVGSALFRKVEAEAKKKKMNSVFLLALVGCPAQEFYKGRGYRTNNWVLMAKALAGQMALGWARRFPKKLRHAMNPS